MELWIYSCQFNLSYKDIHQIFKKWLKVVSVHLRKSIGRENIEETENLGCLTSMFD